MPASPQADMTTAPIDPADDLGQQEVHTDPPADERTPSVVADAPPMFGKGSGHQIGRRVHSELFCPPPPVRAGQPKPLPGSAMVSTNVPTLGVSRSGRERKKNSKLQDDNWGISDKELWAKKEIEAIKAQRQRFATEEDTQDTEFYVVRTEDVDPGGRHLVGIESGPYSDLYSAVSHLDKTPSYCPTSMSAELILLANDARAYQDHSVSSRSGDGCHRFVIKGADKEKAIRLHGVWKLENAAVEAVKHAEQYGLDCFDLQRSLGAITDRSASNPPFFGSVVKPKTEPKRKGKDRKGPGVSTVDSYPPGWFPLDAVKSHENANNDPASQPGSEKGQDNADAGVGGPIRARDEREKEESPGPYTPKNVQSTSPPPAGNDDKTTSVERERQAAVAAAEAARLEWEQRERERLSRQEVERWYVPPPQPVDPMPAPPPRMPKPSPEPLIPIPAEISDVVRTKVLECFESQDDAGRVHELHQMGQKVLQNLFKLAFDKTTKSNNNMWLRRKIAGAMGMQMFDLNEPTQQVPIATRRSSRQSAPLEGAEYPAENQVIETPEVPAAVKATPPVEPDTAPAADVAKEFEPEPSPVNEPEPPPVNEPEPSPEPAPRPVEIVGEELAPMATNEDAPPAEDEDEEEDDEAVDAKMAEEFAKDGVPFVPGKYYGGSHHISDDVSNVRASLEEYHSLRGQVMGGEDASKEKPSLPPPPRGRTQFQLATMEANYHVLAIRCGEGGVDSFSVRLNDRGYVYVGAKQRRKSKKSPSPDADGQEQTSEREAEPEDEKPDTASQSSEEEPLGEFEAIMKFPTLIEESSAQSVFKDGVLFVVANPRRAQVIATMLA